MNPFHTEESRSRSAAMRLATRVTRRPSRWSRACPDPAGRAWRRSGASPGWPRAARRSQLAAGGGARAADGDA